MPTNARRLLIVAVAVMLATGVVSGWAATVIDRDAATGVTRPVLFTSMAVFFVGVIALFVALDRWRRVDPYPAGVAVHSISLFVGVVCLAMLAMTLLSGGTPGSLIAVFALVGVTNTIGGVVGLVDLRRRRATLIPEQRPKDD